MQNKVKENLSEIQLVISSASSTNERTEDDVGDEMDISLLCDGCKLLIGGLVKLDLMECGHFYCPACAPKQLKENHTNCITSTSPTSAFTREISPQQIAEHDGELSLDSGVGEQRIAKGSNNPAKNAQNSKNKSGRNRRSKKAADQQLWYFLHLSKPVVVSLATDATYGDLLSRLYLVLGVDSKTHEIHLRTQKSSSEEVDGESATPGDQGHLEVADSKARLSDLRIPRQKMLILDVDKRKKLNSSDDEKCRKKNSKGKV